MTTTALLCVAKNEQPFTEEWLEYHLGIGFDRVYYVSTDSDVSPIRRLIDRSRFRNQVELSTFDALSPSWQVRCYNEHLPAIREDWVLPLDVDEFLYLQGRGSIQEFLAAAPDPVNQIQFPWLNLISHHYWHDRVFDLLSRSRPHVSDHVKSIVRARDVIRLGVHAHSLRRPKSRLSSGRKVTASSRHGFLLEEPRPWIEHPLILHFCSRGHMDVLLRIAEQSFFNQKCGPSERARLRRYLREAADWENIPTRYMLMQYWASMPTAEIQLHLPKLEARTDVRRLKESFQAGMDKLLGFEAPIEDAPIEDLSNADLGERFEARYRLAYKIQAQSQVAHYDLREYSKHPTQLAYIQARRASLIRSENRGKRGKPVFIQVSKNAGSSIVAACGADIHSAGHRTALSWVREQSGKHGLFAVIRNPFDRVVSEYFYRKRRYQSGDKNPHLSNLSKSFEDWVLSTYRDGELRTRVFFAETGIVFNEQNMINDELIWFVPQMVWLGDGQGRLLVHDLLRFENLEWDWISWAKKQSLTAKLSRRNVSTRRRDYRSYYSAETRNLVADHYRDDIEAFGYVF